MINDEEASSHVFTQISGPAASSGSSSRKSKIKNRGDLEDEFGLAVRPNEGEAAEHGIYYDDTSYDYMQHMRDIGTSGTEATWIEAPARQGDRKRKDKQQSLEDALREASLADDEDDLESVGGMSFASRATGKSVIRPKYEAQQDIPDAIKGFQPDMDPRLREVLEALDDEAYVEEEDDFFADLAREGGEEVDQEEFEAQFYDDDEEGWESDTTEKPAKEYDDIPTQAPPATMEHLSQQPVTHLPDHDYIPDATTDGDWLASFAKSKATSSAPIALARATPSEVPSAAYTTATNGRRKKRKGALTSASGFSMTSSALARTEALSVLDERFERIADSYMNDIPEDEEELDDSMSQMTGMSRASRVTAKTNGTWKTNMTGRSKASAWGGSQFGGSQFGGSQAPSEAPSLVDIGGSGFDAMMDDFLGGVGGHGRGRRMKKGGKAGVWGQQTGMEQLDEIRQGLGPARLSARKSAKV